MGETDRRDDSICAGRGGRGACTVVLRALPGCIDSLRVTAAMLAPRTGALVAEWQRGYRDRFGDQGFFDDELFPLWHTEEVSGLLDRLGGADREAIATWYRERGTRLREMGVPFDELSLSFHLLTRAIGHTLAELMLPSSTVAEAREQFDALAHARLTILSNAYFGERHCADEDRSCLLSELARLQRDVAGRDRFCGMVGSSLAMQRLYETLTAAARTRSTVLLVGESGTGKELAAQAIHRLAGESMDRYVPVNCAALPDELMESELFGYRKGAFSGASSDRKGLFQAADGGTLYLDEITELAPGAQAKLLRAIQEERVRAVGATTEESVRARILASTNIPLQQALEEGQLRRDLYYRLQGFVVELPPLRERGEDLPLLVSHIIERLRDRQPELSVRGVSRGGLERLAGHGWPGNVRELQMVVERASLTTRNALLEADDLELSGADTSPGIAPVEGEADDPISLKEAERRAISAALRATGGNKARASRMLGISRKQLYVKIDRYGLQKIR